MVKSELIKDAKRERERENYETRSLRIIDTLMLSKGLANPGAGSVE